MGFLGVLTRDNVHSLLFFFLPLSRTRRATGRTGATCERRRRKRRPADPVARIKFGPFFKKKRILNSLAAYCTHWKYPPRHVLPPVTGRPFWLAWVSDQWEASFGSQRCKISVTFSILMFGTRVVNSVPNNSNSDVIKSLLATWVYIGLNNTQSFSRFCTFLGGSTLFSWAGEALSVDACLFILRVDEWRQANQMAPPE